jgi:hypothetical protein
MPVAQTFTARAALAISRAAYRALLDRALEGADGHAMGVAQRAFGRGYQALVALEATASDVALSPDAEEAFAAYLLAIRTADEDAALMWLDLFPEMMRDVRRGADLPVEIFGTFSEATAEVVRARGDRQTKPEYQPAANKQPALALAA